MIKSFAIRVSSVVVAAVMMLAAAFVPTENYDVRDPEECKLNFSILSDSHIETTNLPRYRIFNKCLQDAAKIESGNDAVVFLGDNTMNGQVLENMMFHGAVRMFLKKDQTVLPVVGNHDIGNDEGDPAKLRKRWCDFTNAFFGKKLETPYYSEVIDGYTFIVLGPEGNGDTFDLSMSEAQFTWLENTLKEAGKSDKPVFVFAHYPPDDATDLDGKPTDRLIDMLAEFNKENDVIFFYGHTHMPLYLFWSFRDDDGFPTVNLPRLTELGGEKDNQVIANTGKGVVVEVYGDRVIVRGRDFYRGEWYIESDGEVCEKTYMRKHPEPQEETEITPLPFPFFTIPETTEPAEPVPAEPISAEAITN